VYKIHAFSKGRFTEQKLEEVLSQVQRCGAERERPHVSPQARIVLSRILRGPLDEIRMKTNRERLLTFALHHRDETVNGVNRHSTSGLAQQRYVKSHRNLLRSPHSGPHPGTPYRPIRVTGVGRPLESFCFRGLKSAESVRRSGLWTSQVGQHLMAEQMRVIDE